MRAPFAAATIVVLAALSQLTVAHAALGSEGVPGYQHVGVLVLENESESATWGPSSVARYLNSLVPSGAFAANYYADGHVSLDNYITMTSGQPGNPDTYSDCLPSNLFLCQQSVNDNPAFGSGVNIFDQVRGAGLSWKEYADSMPTPCFHQDESPTATAPDPYQGNGGGDATYKGNYADRHNPYTYYTDIVNDPGCAQHDVPFTDLSGDIAANKVPGYFFITPDTCHDGHDSPCAAGTPQQPCSAGGAPSADSVAGGLTSADCWLHANLPALLAYLSAHDGLLLITSDEGAVPNDTSGCCTGGPGGSPGFGGKVGLLALGAGVRAGYTSTTSYDHVSLLRTTEDALGISTHLNNASSATAMSDLFAQPAANTPEAPLTVGLPLAGVAAAALLWRRSRRADRAAAG